MFRRLPPDPVEQEGFGEPVMIQLRNGPRAGRLICQMRTGRETPIYQCESDDEGKTWTKAYPLQWMYSRFGRSRPIVGTDPDLIEMQDGTLVMAFGHKPDYQEHGNYLAFSVDHGQSWTQVVPISSTVTRAYCGVTRGVGRESCLSCTAHRMRRLPKITAQRNSTRWAAAFALPDCRMRSELCARSLLCSCWRWLHP